MLPKDLGNLEFLKELDASSSGLEELPSSFCNLRSLKSICISGCNNLKKLPGNLGTLESLEKLYSSRSALEELPSSFCNLRSLKTLDISGCNNLKKLPGNLGTLESLEELYSSRVALEELPSSFCNLRSLKTLVISGCKNLKKLPGNLGTLESLEKLDSSQSALEELPSSFCNLRCPKTLDISGCNNLKKLPDNLRNLESLEELNACGSGLEELPDIPQNLKELLAANCKSLKSAHTRLKFPLSFLDLGNCDKLNAEASSTIQQSLRESQYLSTYKCGLRIVGSEVPQWMKYRNSNGSSLSFEFDIDGHSIWFIFCAVVVSGYDCSNLWLKACLTDRWGDKMAYLSRLVDLHCNLEHVILSHGLIRYDVREASFEIGTYDDEIRTEAAKLQIKSIGVHPKVERGDDRKRKREEEEVVEESNEDDEEGRRNCSLY